MTSFRGTPASSSAISWAVAPAHDQTTPSSTINSHTTCLDATASTQVFLRLAIRCDAGSESSDACRVTRLVEVGSPEPHSGQVSIRGSYVKVSAGRLYRICRLGTSADPGGQRFGARARHHTIVMH